MAPSTILFDLDGTLIDSIGLIVDCYQHTSEIHLGRRLEREEIIAGLGRPLHAEFSRWAQDPGEVQAMVTTYRTRNLERHDDCVSAYEGAKETIATLSKRGICLGIVTSKLGETARRGLRVCGFEDVFEVVIGSADVENHKPHPEPVQRALEKLGVSAGDSLFVGDSPHDLEAGQKAGVAVGAALWGPFSKAQLIDMKPDYAFESPSQILDL